MKQFAYRWTMMLLFAVAVGGSILAVAAPQSVNAQGEARPGPPRSGELCGGILTLPPWYRGLTDGNCNILSPTQVGGLSPFIWTIVLNVIEMLMQVVGYITIGFLIFGGFKYMTAQGEASKVVQAKDTIRNALIGLIIAIFSVAIVNFAAGAIT